MIYSISKTFSKLLPENIERFKNYSKSNTESDFENLPQDADKFKTFENFKKKVYSNIKFNNLILPEDNLDFDSLLLTLYELPKEEYKNIRTNCRIDFSILKHNALLVNRIITEALSKNISSVAKINILTDMVNRKKSLADKIFLSVDPNIDEHDLKYLDAINQAVDNEEAIKEIKNTFVQYFYWTINDNLLSDFFFEQLEDIVPEMYRQIKFRTNKYYAYVDYEERSRYNQFKESVITKKIKSQGKINQTKF